MTACSLPEPDGTEAAFLEKAAGRPDLQPGEGRSPEAVVRNGLLLSPDVRASASRVSASADEVRIQRAAIFPSLGLSIGGGVGAAAIEDATIDLTGRQLILDFGRTKRAVTVADLDLQIDYLDFQKSVDDAIVEVLEAYDEVLKYVRLSEVRQEQFNAIAALQKLVADQTNSGAVPTSDLLETRKRVQSAEFLYHETELALAEARDRLAELTGHTRGGRVPVMDVSTCASPDADDDVQKARLELAKSHVVLQNAEKARQPRAYLEPLARKTAGDSGVSLGVNVGVDSDILQGGALSAQVNAARNERDRAQAQIDAAARKTALDAAGLKRRLSASQMKSDMLKRQIDLLSQTKSLYRSQYFELGTREISDLLDNEEEFFDRQAQLIEEASELAKTRITCARNEKHLRDIIGVTKSNLFGFPL